MNEMDKWCERIFKVVGALSTVIMFTLFMLAVFGLYHLVSTGFFSSRYCTATEYEMPGLNIESLPLPWIMALIPSLIVLSILFIKTELGKPVGGQIRLSDVFDKPTRLFNGIKNRGYSVKNVMLLILVISLLSGGFGSLNGYIFAQAKYAWMINAPRYMPEGDWMFPQLSALDFLVIYLPLIVISSMVGGFIQFFALTFFLYWFSRAVGARICYLNLYTLTAYLSVIPLTLLGISTLVNAGSYLLCGNVSTLNTEFLPLIGYGIFYIACMYGIQHLGDISLKRSFLAVSPFLLITVIIIYLMYFFTYELVPRIVECVYLQLGL